LPAGGYGLDFFLRGNALACNICVRRQNPGLKLFEEDRTFAAVEDWMFMLENTQADAVYLVDAVTLTMNDHDARSMRADNQALIGRWLKLMQWVAVHLQLAPAQSQQLQGHIYYLCAIHAYADNHRQQAVGYLRQAWPLLPLRKALSLTLRILAGPRMIGLIKGVRG
jgi:GalNAc5-diNAcBac-PP-undecaprenol beta-1,3-glucosyltransferase